MYIVTNTFFFWGGGYSTFDRLLRIMFGLFLIVQYDAYFEINFY